MSTSIPEHIEFTKMTAGGNDFVCIDNTSGAYNRLMKSRLLPDFIRSLCRRGLAVGADGVIFACERGAADGVNIVARFMEPDGTEARLCGNGTACFTYWSLAKKLVSGPRVTILTAAGTAQAEPDPENPRRIRVCVPNPRNPEMGIRIRAGGREWTLDVIDTGVPHAVAFVEDLEELDVAHLGAAIRNHERFRDMGGVNANFTTVIGEGEIAVRTFEFGVEAETLACGTGCTAAAIFTCLRQGWPAAYRTGKKPVRVRVRGGELLRIWFTVLEDGAVVDVCLETGARPIYDGVLRHEFLDELNSRDVPEPIAATEPRQGTAAT
jgi:diaminopimelate epimerase